MSKLDPLTYEWGVICKSSVTDQQSNALSIFNIIEEIVLPSEIFEAQKKSEKTIIMQPSYEVITYWRRKIHMDVAESEINAEIKLTTIGTGEENLQEILAPLILPKKMQNIRFKFIVPGLVINQPGIYVKRIEIKFPEDKKFKFVKDIPYEIKETPRGNIV